MLKFIAGQEIREFTLHERVPRVDEGGRVLYDVGAASGIIRAASSEISPREVERYAQTEHPATHRMIVRGKADVKPGDVLRRDGASYYVQWVRDVGLLSAYTVIFCEKRSV